MKKIFLISALGIVIIILCIVLTYLISGSLWGKAEAKKKAQEYLNLTYSQKMVKGKGNGQTLINHVRSV